MSILVAGMMHYELLKFFSYFIITIIICSVFLFSYCSADGKRAGLIYFAFFGSLMICVLSCPSLCTFFFHTALSG